MKSVFVENIPVQEYNYYEVLQFKRILMYFLTTTEMANKWKIYRRRVSLLCKESHIEGAFLKGKTWLIPENAIKSVDPRHKSQDETR